VIDDETKYAVGDKVRIVLPAKALHVFPAAHQSDPQVQ
jgi:hypothetical protein